MLTRYESYVQGKKAFYGSAFRTTSLAKKFIPAYNHGQRIRVRFAGADKMVLSGRVGVTTGWKPVFLLVLTSRSLGSPWTLSSKDRIVSNTTPIKRY